MSVRKRLSVLGLLVGMIGLLLVATTGSVGANSASEAVGQIDFSLSSNSASWTYDGLTQSHGRQGCRLTTSGDDLVSVTGDSTVGSNPYAGLFKGAIGVKDNNEGNGEPCSRVDPGQSLTLALGSDITSQGLVANAAQIALSFKFDATAQLDMYRDGSFVRNVSFACVGGSDCGPDSGANDVGIVDVPEGAIFDTIVITSDGAVSLVDDLVGTHIHLVLPEITIEGTKWHDRDFDGERDEIFNAEEALEGWRITAYGDAGPFMTTTDANGEYLLTVPPGDYIVCEAPPANEPPLGDNISWTQSDLTFLNPTSKDWSIGACS
ncbi:MAG: hypothetical protein KJN71_07900, partial [Acidimicrobiia bacterium]|nr:hypothetical protein [Acidimicrobiia bacterium]